MSSFRANLALALLIGLGSVAHCGPLGRGSKGAIAPRPGAGITLAKARGATTADIRCGPLEVRLGVTTGGGFLNLHVQVRNTGKTPFRVTPDQLEMALTDGATIDPLPAATYGEMAYPQVQPYELDAKGNISVPEREALPVQLGQYNGQSGTSMAEQMAMPEDAHWNHQERMRVTKELKALLEDPFERGATLDPGQTIVSRRVFQRNGLELPFIVRLKVAGATTNVTFDRER